MSYCDVAKARQQVYNAARPAMHTAQNYTVPSVPLPCDHTARRCPALHCIANSVQRSVLAAVSPSQVKFCSRGSKPFAGEAERSGKRGYYAQDASEGVRSSASLRPAATAYTARSIEQCALYSTQGVCAAARCAGCAVRTIVQQCALRNTQRDESRKKTHYMCHATIKSAHVKTLIARAKMCVFF